MTTTRYVVRDVATGGADFLLWGDGDFSTALVTLASCNNDGLEVELIAFDPLQRVNVYGHDVESDLWTLEATCGVAECFPDDTRSQAEAAESLRLYGSFVTGGGSAPLFKLESVS